MNGSGSSEPTHQERIQALVDAGDIDALARAAEELHPSDIADILVSLAEEYQQVALVQALPPGLGSEALAEMEDDEQAGDLLAALEPAAGAALLHELADDDAVDLIGELEPHEAHAILEALPSHEAGELRGLLLYDEETAGGLMTTELVSVHGNLSAEEAIREIRVRGREVEDFYTVFVVDAADRLLGVVPLDDLILADPWLAVSEIAQPSPVTIPPGMDQEEVGRLLSRYNLASVPVCDEAGHLLGRITFDDVIDVMEAEQTEDILRLAGVSDQEEIRADWRDAIRSRLPWLALNLFTAALASSVVLFFEETIETLYYVAYIMPIVAGLGGNSGTQALAVTVRRLAIRSGPLEKRSSVLGKEGLVALVNGAALGLMAFGVAWVVVLAVDDIPVRLPWVVLGALWGTILISGTFGAFIPTILHRLGADPAVASSVFVTTLTDLVGFLILLGLATALLL
ncbi:MAG TPA: magnesium transporter [Longimicrobiales bacterium]|jgi:magnesium transporter